MKPMSRRDVVRALEQNGCTVLREGAKHTIYICAERLHRAAVPRHNTITAGVVASIQKAMTCLPKGWLQ